MRITARAASWSRGLSMASARAAARHPDELGLVALAFRHIASDEHAADDVAVAISHRREHHREVDGRTVLPQPAVLQIADLDTGPDLRHHDVLEGAQTSIGRPQAPVAPDRFLGREAEHALGAPVPGRHDAVEIDADDAVRRRIDHRGKERLIRRRLQSLGDVAEVPGPATYLADFQPHGGGVALDRATVEELELVIAGGGRIGVDLFDPREERLRVG
jgi:hypothetical protein